MVADVVLVVEVVLVMVEVFVIVVVVNVAVVVVVVHQSKSCPVSSVSHSYHLAERPPPFGKLHDDGYSMQTSPRCDTPPSHEPALVA